MELHKDAFAVYDKTVSVLSVEFERGVYVWVGDEQLSCRDLHCGFPLKNGQGEDSVGSTLIGDLDAISADLAKMLAKRFQVAVFMSFNLAETDCAVLGVMQEELIKVLSKMYPQYSTTSAP